MNSSQIMGAHFLFRNITLSSLLTSVIYPPFPTRGFQQGRKWPRSNVHPPLDAALLVLANNKMILYISV